MTKYGIAAGCSNARLAFAGKVIHVYRNADEANRAALRSASQTASLELQLLKLQRT